MTIVAFIPQRYFFKKQLNTTRNAETHTMPVFLEKNFDMHTHTKPIKDTLKKYNSVQIHQDRLSPYK